MKYLLLFLFSFGFSFNLSASNLDQLLGAWETVQVVCQKSGYPIYKPKKTIVFLDDFQTITVNSVEYTIDLKVDEVDLEENKPSGTFLLHMVDAQGKLHKFPYGYKLNTDDLLTITNHELKDCDDQTKRSVFKRIAN